MLGRSNSYVLRAQRSHRFAPTFCNVRTDDRSGPERVRPDLCAERIPISGSALRGGGGVPVPPG